MSARRPTFIALGISALALPAFVPKLAIPAQERGQLGALSACEEIYIDQRSFFLVRGIAKTDPAAGIMKQKEVPSSFTPATNSTLWTLPRKACTAAGPQRRSRAISSHDGDDYGDFALP